MNAMVLLAMIIFCVTNSTSSEINDRENNNTTQFYEKLKQNQNLLQMILKFIDTFERIKFLNTNPCGFHKTDSRLLCLKDFQDKHEKQYSLKKITNISPWVRFFLLQENLEHSEITVLFTIAKLENLKDHEKKIEIVLDSLLFKDIQFFLTMDNIFKAFDSLTGNIIEMYALNSVLFDLQNIQIFNPFGYQNNNNYLVLPSTKKGISILNLEIEDIIMQDGNFENSMILNLLEEIPGIEHKKIKKFHVAPFSDSVAPDVTLLTTENEILILHVGIDESDWFWHSVGKKLFGEKIIDIQFIKEELQLISRHVRIILENGESLILRKDEERKNEALPKVITIIDETGSISHPTRTIRKEFLNEFPFDSFHTDNITTSISKL